MNIYRTHWEIMQALLAGKKLVEYRSEDTSWIWLWDDGYIYIDSDDDGDGEKIVFDVFNYAWTDKPKEPEYYWNFWYWSDGTKVLCVTPTKKTRRQAGIEHGMSNIIGRVRDSDGNSI